MNETSFLKSLFFGVLADSLAFPFPELPRTQVDAIYTKLEALRRAPKGGTWLDTEGLGASEDVLEHLAREGFFGLSIPAAYGGQGFSLGAAARVIQEVAQQSFPLATMLVAHDGLAANALLGFGSDAAKQDLLPALASGASLGAFALAEAGAGSDASAIRTYADLEDGQYRVRGEKGWTINGGIAKTFVVIARTSSPEENSKPHLTAFACQNGVTPETSPTLFGLDGAYVKSLRIDSKVPMSHVLGERGRGFKVATEVFGRGRLELAAACLGACKRVLRATVERAESRKAFSRSISDFGFVKDKLATMMSDTFALESVVYLTCGLVDAGVPDTSLESAAAKILGSETLYRASREAMQIAAGFGFQEGPFSRMYRDARFPLVFQGTNETLRCFIALSGMQSPGKAQTNVARAMREPIKGFGLLSDFAVRKAKSAFARERLGRVHPVLSREAAFVEERAQELARAVDRVLKKHKDAIAEMQFTQKRVSGVAIELFSIVATLSRTSRAIERRGEEGSRREIELTLLHAARAGRRIDEHLAGFEKNDDELRKAVATRGCADGGYPFDVM